MILWNDALADVISSRRTEAKEAGREEIPNPMQTQAGVIYSHNFCPRRQLHLSSRNTVESLERSRRSSEHEP